MSDGHVPCGHADLSGQRRGRVAGLNCHLSGQIETQTQLAQANLQGMQAQTEPIDPDRSAHVAEQPPGSVSAQLRVQGKRQPSCGRFQTQIGHHGSKRGHVEPFHVHRYRGAPFVCEREHLRLQRYRRPVQLEFGNEAGATLGFPGDHAIDGQRADIEPIAEHPIVVGQGHVLYQEPGNAEPAARRRGRPIAATLRFRLRPRQRDREAANGEAPVGHPPHVHDGVPQDGPRNHHPPGDEAEQLEIQLEHLEAARLTGAAGSIQILDPHPSGERVEVHVSYTGLGDAAITQPAFRITLDGQGRGQTEADQQHGDDRRNPDLSAHANGQGPQLAMSDRSEGPASSGHDG